MTVHVAGIGLGGLGVVQLELLSELDDVEVVAGVDVNDDARDSFAASFDADTHASVEALLAAHPELDAVTIVTPHTLHYEQAMACLEVDVAVHVEKPMTTDLDRAADLVRTARERSVPLTVGYQTRWDPRFTELRSMITEGEIGRPHTVVGFLQQDWISPHDGSWRTNPGLSGGGQLYDSGSHLLDILCWAVDATPETVAATIDDQGNDVDVNSALALSLSSGSDTITGTVTVSGDGPTGPDLGEGLVVWGTEGGVELVDERLTVTRPGGQRYETTVETPDFRATNRQKLRNFVDTVRGEADPAVPGEDGLRVVALTEAAYEAAETGRTVDVATRIENALDD